MTTVFISYSTKDHYFAELAGIKLAEAGINLWRDQGQLRPGSDWRNGIERGISESICGGIRGSFGRAATGAME